MLTVERFRVLVKALKAAFPNTYFIPDADAFHMWHTMLGDFPYEALEAAVQKYILTRTTPPTIADIRGLATDIMDGETASWEEGWAQVLDAIEHYGSWDEVGALDSMDDITATCVRRLGWQSICQSENPTADRANFRMVYEAVARRRRDDRQLPEALTQKIAQILPALERKEGDTDGLTEWDG